MFVLSPGPWVIIIFSAEHKIFPTHRVGIVGILTFMSGKNSIIGLSEPKEN